MLLHQCGVATFFFMRKNNLIVRHTTLMKNIELTKSGYKMPKTLLVLEKSHHFTCINVIYKLYLQHKSQRSHNI